MCAVGTRGVCGLQAWGRRGVRVGPTSAAGSQPPKPTRDFQVALHENVFLHARFS